MRYLFLASLLLLTFAVVGTLNYHDDRSRSERLPPTLFTLHEHHPLVSVVEVAEQNAPDRKGLNPPAVLAMNSSTSLKPADSAAREDLTIELQRELRRVGCYKGLDTGVWSPATELAAHDLVARANARLPVDKPDYALLALVKPQSDMLCVTPCAGNAADDQCPSHAQVTTAQADGQTPLTLASPDDANDAERMSLGVPVSNGSNTRHGALHARRPASELFLHPLGQY